MRLSFTAAEEEDVKPDPAAFQDAAEHRRRVRDTTLGSGLGEEKRNENKRRRIANAPSVMPKTDQDEENLRTPKAEDAEAAVTGVADESDEEKKKKVEPNPYPRLTALSHGSINIFKPSTFDIVPKMNVSAADTQRMLDLGGFHRSDLGSALQDTTVSLKCRQRKYGYDTHRMCVKGSVNFGCRGPGKAFVLTTGLFSKTNPEFKKVDTVYAGDRNPTDDEPWRPYVKYKYLWCGLANKGEFNSLGAEAALRTEVIDVFMEYLHGNEDKYSEGLFENVFVQLDPTSSTLYDAWATRRDAPKPAQRAAIERSLRENNGLQIGYAVLVYVGPMLEAEIRDIVAAREERRTREAPWKVAVEQYEADLKIWKKEAKRAKAKGEAGEAKEAEEGADADEAGGEEGGQADEEGG
ncbi:hypothetical protein JCM10296v2_007765 [Rhodotorula toruloides]